MMTALLIYLTVCYAALLPEMVVGTFVEGHTMNFFLWLFSPIIVPGWLIFWGIILWRRRRNQQ